MTFDDLTPEQKAVVLHDGEAFVEACPGSGKTGTIVARVVEKARTTPPRRGLAVLSFTNSAVEEFQQRLGQAGQANLCAHPHFIGTVDSFIRTFLFTPGGAPDCAVRPLVVDSWATLGMEIRLNGRNAFRGPGVSLDRFDAETGAIDPATIGHNGLRAHVAAQRAAYEERARQVRRRCNRNGIYSAAEARLVAQDRLRTRDWSDALQAALGARFAEVIVDEAQDCNPADLEIVTWLRQAGIPVTLVCDLDQSIYAFRQGIPAALRASKRTYAAENQIRLTGNFRSSPAICAVASTLRTQAATDQSVGITKDVAHRVLIISFDGSPIPAIGAAFAERAAARDIKAEDCIVLAHGRATARAAAGASAPLRSGQSNVETLARAVGQYNCGTSTGRAREEALVSAERLILSMVGALDPGEPVQRTLEALDVDRRAFRRLALQLVTSMPQTCEATDAARSNWVAAARQVMTEFDLPLPEGTTLNRLLATRANANWDQHLAAPPAQVLASATVHEAKGREYEGVCLVIPPDPPGRARLGDLLDSWERRLDVEPKRVVYVGVTRARRLLALAIPRAQKARVLAILAAAGDVFDEQDL